jgi:hypothetical protein
MSRLSQARIDAALAKAEPAIRRAFLEAIAEHKAGINLRALAEALERGDIQAALNIAQINAAMLYPVDQAITSTYVVGGQMVAASAPAFAVSFGFDGRATRAEAWARANAAGLVVDIVQGQREALQGLIGERLAAGSSPAPLARQIRDVVGLDGPRLQRVENMRQALSSPLGVGVLRLDAEGKPVKAFWIGRNGQLMSAYERRDKRFDGIIRRAIQDGKLLSQTDIERFTAAYARKSLDDRAKAIARTESLNALRAGRDEGVKQAIEQGAADGVRKRWSTSGDERVREDHVAMDGVEADLDEPFELPDGSLMMHPGDSSLGADAGQVINCRCLSEYFVDWSRA